MPPQPPEIGSKCILDRPRAGRRPNRPRSSCRSLWISEGGGDLCLENAVLGSGSPGRMRKCRRVGGGVPMCSLCPLGLTGTDCLHNGRTHMDLARSEGRRPRPKFGLSKNLGAVSLSHSRLVPMRGVGTIVPRPPGRVPRVNMWLASQIQGRSC